MTANPQTEPRLFAWVAKVAAAAGLAGMICCVAPMVLFMFGLMGAAYALSFAGFFYSPKDGSPAAGAYILRACAVMIGIGGIWLYRRKQNQCSIDPVRKRRNLVMVAILVPLLGLGVFLSLDWLSGWYFKRYIVPAHRSTQATAPP